MDIPRGIPGEPKTPPTVCKPRRLGTGASPKDGTKALDSRMIPSQDCYLLPFLRGTMGCKELEGIFLLYK